LLGAEACLVGRSHECDYPGQVTVLPALTGAGIAAEFTRSADVDRAVSRSLSDGGSLYRLDVDRLHELGPDLIITQDLCRVCSIDLETVREAAARMSPRPEIFSMNAASFEDVLDNIVRVGRALGLERRASERVVQLRERFFRAADHVNGFADPTRVLFLEWTEPPFVAGHWTAQLVERAGAVSLLNPTTAMAGAGAGAGGQMAHRVAGPSIRVTREQIERAAPEAIIVCPCGLALEQTRREYEALAREEWWRSLPAVRSGRVALVDGNAMFNRPGPRLVDAYEWLVGWLNGVDGLIPPGFPWLAAP